MIKSTIKRILRIVSPAYRVSIRLEEQNQLIFEQFKQVLRRIDVLEKRIDAIEKRSDEVFWVYLGYQKQCSVEEVKKDFFTLMRPASNSLRKIQNLNTYLLKSLKKICDENSIHFFLQEGTLLGAIRHKGFVPWDDDIDIGMLRGEYKRLLECIEKYQDFKIIVTYDFPGKCRTAKFCLNDESIPGFVDIFLYDYYEADGRQPEDIWKYVNEIRSTLWKEVNQNKDFFAKKYWNEEIENVEDLRKMESLYDKYLDMLQVPKDGKYVYWSIENYQVKPLQRVFLKDDIFPLETAEFEGETFNVPRDYEKCLQLRYGDYYTIPGDIGRQKHIKKMQPYMKQIEKFIEKNDLER